MKTPSSKFSLFASLLIFSSCGGGELKDPLKGDSTRTPNTKIDTPKTIDPNFHYLSQFEVTTQNLASPLCMIESESNISVGTCSQSNSLNLGKFLDRSIRLANGWECLEIDRSYMVRVNKCSATDRQAFKFREDSKIESIYTPNLCFGIRESNSLGLTECESADAAVIKEVNVHYPETYLYNPGPRFRASDTYFKTETGSSLNYRGAKIVSTDLSEAHLTGAPKDACNEIGVNDGTGLQYSTNKACPSFAHDTSVGWTIESMHAYPGFAIWTMGGGNGKPLMFQYLNHALHASDPCRLRETGLIYHSWDHSPYTHLKPNDDGSTKKLGDVENLYGTFTGKVPLSETNIDGALSCTNGAATSNINADLRFAYMRDGRIVRYDIIGVIPYYEFDWTPGEDIFWTDNCDQNSTMPGRPDIPSCMILIKGDRIALPKMNDRNQSYVINYTEIIRRLQDTGRYNPPSGFSYKDAIVRGFDVYTSVRGTNLQLQVQGVDLYGH